ncbi:hypothetical protein K469DRAFT_565394, partial [Zopfia rhizophila CBS 207.26]
QSSSDHCTATRLGEPTWQDVSDRRGGRTAWSSLAVVQGIPYSARFWYDGAYMEQAREDAAEVAMRHLTGTQTTSASQSTTYYTRGYAA